jgi:glycosyl hydrolase family 44
MGAIEFPRGAAFAALWLLAGCGAGSAPAPRGEPVSFTVDSSQDVHPISRFIYGMNSWDPSARPKNLALSRSGGNRMTAYNWETNASNAGADWYNVNDDYLGGGDLPNGAVRPGLEAARAAGAGMLVTVPMIGYVSADTDGGGDVARTPNYLAVRFHRSVARKPGAFARLPDTSDGVVYQDEYVHFLDRQYPGAFAATANPLMISLDNEPDLWQHTHARLRGDGNVGTQAGRTATYAEIVERTTEYADAIKHVNPAALIFGPVNYGWQGMVRFQNAPDANDRDFLDFYLARMKDAEASHGRRLVDVLDVHWYPAPYPACEANPVDGCPVSGEDTDAAVVAARKQAPRSLWDAAYTEDSWIAKYGTLGPIRLLPRLRDKLATNYPGTRLAISEYYYGAGNHISGAIAQADVLGVFGREGLFAASVWPRPGSNFLNGAFEMYRDFDGANGSFGDTSIRAVTSDAVKTSVYASVDAGNANRMVLVCINKDDATHEAGIAITHPVRLRVASLYQLTADSARGRPRALGQLAMAADNRLAFTMPANSVTTLVLLP